MSKRIALIVDDEPDVAEWAADVALECGFDARIVIGGDALNSTAHLADVIVLDLLMPGMDGIAVLSSLAATGSRAQIILMSGMGQHMLDSTRKVAAIQNLSVAGVLQKPFRPAELRKLLESIGTPT